ncbi:hypothetical protein F5Y14DRAFT_461550 [Nemania sp. NC0429]|nr:hypothetical protein F5Y14DRAFT_461550 [Nemania sp. NC0429]
MEALSAGIPNLRISLKQCCCNDSDATPCEKPGSFACKSCLMVAYCSKPCQKAHWEAHRKDCKSPFMNHSWEPRWVTENRTPYFIDGPPHTPFGTPKYLWGNVPAVDVVQLGRNEGVDFQGPLRLLFAASGDMRNAVFSAVSLPPSYRGPLDITINDREIDIVARNLIFLLVFFLEENPAACNQFLHERVKPLVAAVCRKIALKPGTDLFGKTWQFAASSLRLVLTRDGWFSLLRYFDVPRGLTKDIAQRVRQKVMSATERVDYVDIFLCTMSSPSSRLGMMKFRGDGILLPFGQSRAAFTNPNPTLFLSPDEWPMMDNADPTAGWPMKSFLEFDAGPATNDVHGKLHFYLRDLFGSLHCRIRSSPVTFELLRVDAIALPISLAGKQFDRIDVGNICDTDYLGIETTLATFRPLLQPLSVNPHAALITLFLDAIAEMQLLDATHPRFNAPFIDNPSQRLRKVLQYMPELGRQNSHENRVKLVCALSLSHDMDKFFNWYMKEHGFGELAANTGLQIKSTHTIVDAWLWRMPSDARPTPRARKDFALLLSSALSGQERFVEWKLAPKVPIEDVDV